MTKGTEQLPALWLFQATHYGTGAPEAVARNTQRTCTQWIRHKLKVTKSKPPKDPSHICDKVLK